MELRQLEYFIKIVEAGSISEGARSLHMSQPPLSHQMKLLEEELGVRLFERGHRTIQLTQAGSLLYQRATTLLGLERSAAREVSNAGSRTMLHMGITPTTQPFILPRLKELSRTYPQLCFSIHDDDSFTLLDLLQQGVIELAVLRSPVQTDGLETRTVCREPMLAAWAGEVLPSNMPVFDLSMLSGHPLLIYRRYHDLIVGAFHSRGLSFDIFCECDDARTVLQWAQAGMGVALFPASMSPLCAGLTTRALPEPELETEIILVKRKADSLSEPAAQLFFQDHGMVEHKTSAQGKK